MMRWLIALLSGWLVDSATAQEGPPGTDIYLIDLASPERVVNLTRRPGYDNQPAFSADGSTLYFTRFENGQTDIYATTLDPSDRHTQAVTQTAESEYSPTLVPGMNALSVVRVEADGRQLLWCLPLAGGEPRLLLPDIEPVGYHTWLEADRLGLFVLGESMMLQSATVGPGPGQLLTTNIGRGLQRWANGQLVFVTADDPALIRLADPTSGEISTLIPARVGSQDFVVAGDTIWMAQKNHLYSWRNGDSNWQRRVSFAEPGLQNITRLAINPARTQLAFVADEAQP